MKVERDQHVVFKKVAAIDRAEVQQAKRVGCDGRVAVLRIEHVPVAGSQLVQKSKNHIAKQAMPRHRRQRLAGQKAIALRVRVALFDDGIEQQMQVRRGHLPVAVHFHRNVALQFHCLFIAEHGRAAHTQILRRAQGDRSRFLARLDDCGRLVAAAIIDY